MAERTKEGEREREAVWIFIRDTLHGSQTRFAFRRIIDAMDAWNDDTISGRANE